MWVEFVVGSVLALLRGLPTGYSSYSSSRKTNISKIAIRPGYTTSWKSAKADAASSLPTTLSLEEGQKEDNKLIFQLNQYFSAFIYRIVKELVNCTRKQDCHFLRFL